MKRWISSAIYVLSVVGLALPPAVATANNDLESAHVAFGRGMNIAQPGNPVNHAMLPDQITVKKDGVVHFVVSGFHQISIYLPGTDENDILVPTAGTFINDPVNRFYQGILPAGGPLATPETGNPSNASNRVESVSFDTPGTYLVICNVRTHFNDGMFGFVKVLPGK